MNSSVKFLSPIVTGGLPAPGPLEAAGVLDVAAGVLELELFFELPHAASATTKITVRTLPSARLQCCLLMSFLLDLFSCQLCHDRDECLGRRFLAHLQTARRQQPLNGGEHEFDEQGERGDADCGAEHARKVIAGLVVDDVSEAAAVAGECRDRGRRDDE